MLGPGMLVFPVVEANARGWKSYQLPGESSDVWYLAHAPNTAFSGATAAQVQIDMEIPVFYRGGYIIPEKHRKRRSSEQMKEDPYTLVIAASKSNFASGFLYLDDGSSLDYMRNEYELRRFEYSGTQIQNTRMSTTQHDNERKGRSEL
eukprot:TRINITY_DN566_c0_g1_i2.p2 TRINITY_DN566_c0_g1~~TRINITY_DN566_c0_g1_i2.p2  ORF type:complete len:148 (-),score=13.98 TRINITY_DN566_c0_g1_i2:12-455(-)